MGGRETQDRSGENQIQVGIWDGCINRVVCGPVQLSLCHFKIHDILNIIFIDIVALSGK